MQLLATDFAIAAEDATFSLSEVNWGILPGALVSKVVADAVIDAAPAKLWAILSRCAGYAGTLPSISASKELSRSGSLSAGNEKVRCEMTVDLPWPLDDLTSISIARHRRLPKGGFERSWKLESGDYDYIDGSWRLEPRAGGSKTYARYTLLVQPKTRLPDFLKRAAQNRSIPKLFRVLRTLVEAERVDD